MKAKELIKIGKELMKMLHELKHVVEHISEFYRVDPKSEPAAYLQGEIGRQMFPLIIQKMCDC